jgi:hypothetical protein
MHETTPLRDIFLSLTLGARLSARAVPPFHPALGYPDCPDPTTDRYMIPSPETAAPPISVHFLGRLRA